MVHIPNSIHLSECNTLSRNRQVHDLRPLNLGKYIIVRALTKICGVEVINEVLEINIIANPYLGRGLKCFGEHQTYISLISPKSYLSTVL